MPVGSLPEWELALSNHPHPEPFFWYFNSQNPLLGRLQVEGSPGGHFWPGGVLYLVSQSPEVES